MKQKLSKEQCWEITRRYSSYPEFCRAEKALYALLSRLSWREELTAHMVRGMHPSGYWNKERCADEALKYEHRKDFDRGSPSAYAAASRNRWMEEICAHMTPKASRLVRHVYEVVDHERKLVYIGLTYDLAARGCQHRASRRMQKEFPDGVELRLIVGGLSEAEAQVEEAAQIARYQKLGYRLLNSKRAGGLGGTKKKYTFEYCRAAAAKYPTKAALVKAEKYVYVTAHRSGWLDQICRHMRPLKRPNGYWSRERVLEEARKFTDFTDFMQNGDITARGMSGRFGLQDKIRAMIGSRRKPRGYWTKERLIETALGYSSMGAFLKAEPSAYATALHRGWASDIRNLFAERRIPIQLSLELSPPPPDHWRENCKLAMELFREAGVVCQEIEAG